MDRPAPKNRAMASLDAQVSNIDAAKISRELNNWKALTPFLDLTPQQETEIEKSSGDYGEQKRAALLKWKEVKGEKATYRALIAAATEAVIANLADYVRGLIAADGGGIANDGGGASETELSKFAYRHRFRILKTEKLCYANNLHRIIVHYEHCCVHNP